MNDFKIGEFNTLTSVRKEPQGFYLRGDDPFNQVLLPNAYVPEMKLMYLFIWIMRSD